MDDIDEHAHVADVTLQWVLDLTRFLHAWNDQESEGRRDSIGSAEFRRVLSLYVLRRPVANIKRFIMEQANCPSTGERSKMARTQLNASNRLYSGEVTSFVEAMQLTVLCCLQQRVPDAKEYPISEGGRNDLDLNDALDKMRGYALAVLAMLPWIDDEDLEVIMSEWSDSKDGEMSQIGKAYISEDYTILAV